MLGDNVTEEATPRHVRTPDDRPITSRRGNAASQATVNQGPLPNKVPSDADNGLSAALGSAGSLETYFADEMLRQQQQQHQQWLWQAQMPQFPLGLGNFVPNFGLGSGLAAANWQEEVEEVQEPSGRIRQQTHEMSEDEEESVSDSREASKAQKEEGVTAELLKETMAKVKDCNRVTEGIEPQLASLLNRFLKDSKSVTEMEKLGKAYPRIENVEFMKVPRVDEEVSQTLDMRHRNVDQAIQAVQRALMSSIPSLAAVLQLGYSRGAADPEMDELGKNVMDSFRLQSFAHNALSTRRKELIKSELSPVYARELSKRQAASPDWLYGGELMDATKKCEAAKKIGENIGRKRPQMQVRQTQNQKRFRAPNYQGNQTQRFPAMRAFNPYQMQHLRFNSPQVNQPQFQQAFQQPFGYYQNRPHYYNNNNNNNKKQNNQKVFSKLGGPRQ